MRNKKKLKRIYAVEDSDNEYLIIIYCMDIEHILQVRKYTVTNRERLFDLNGKTTFVNRSSGYLKQCSDVGFENKIFFPMLNDEHSSVFFYLKKHKYYSYDCSTNKGVSDAYYLHIENTTYCVWIDHYIFLFLCFL